MHDLLKHHSEYMPPSAHCNITDPEHEKTIQHLPSNEDRPVDDLKHSQLVYQKWQTQILKEYLYAMQYVLP